ncbi:helix-turn-helix domain-containing protein, partial [Bacillus mobilis]
MYNGITKASVSKWETGQSYPDITFLPLLASYFNISIDELI